MKKNLRYYLIVATLMVAMSVNAQMWASDPVPTMRSTSSMVGSGSNLPSAAVGGATMAVYPSLSEPTSHRGPRRIFGGDEDDEDYPSGGSTGSLTGDETGDQNPGQPIGAMPWMLMLVLAGAYAGVTAYRRRGASVD